MESLSTSLLLLLFLVGYSAPHGPEETFGLPLQELSRQQSEILQRLGDQERTLDNYQTMMETLQTMMGTKQTMMETQKNMIQDIKSTMESSHPNITQDISTQHSSLEHAIQDSLQEQYAGCIDKLATGSSQDIPKARPVDCMGHKRMGSTVSGVYEIYPSCCHPVSVWCDMDTGEGGWTVFLARQIQTEPENFRRNWEEYEVGFGNASGEYWIGNKNLHILTDGFPTVLRIDAEDFSGTQRNGTWLGFSIGTPCSNYQLKVNQFQRDISSMGDSLKKSNGVGFSTVDADNDESRIINCAEHNGGGGWWYDECGYLNPTATIGEGYVPGGGLDYYHWNPERRRYTKLRRFIMKIQPRDSQGPARMCQE